MNLLRKCLTSIARKKNFRIFYWYDRYNLSPKFSLLINVESLFIWGSKVCSQDPRSNQQSLSSFLIMPIQRIPRYELLLRELKKKTPEQHPDFDKIDRE